LQLTDVYFAECERYVVLARSIGSTGLAMPVLPNSAEFSDVETSRPFFEPSERKTIALKCYHGWGLGQKPPSRQSEKCQKNYRTTELQGYKIVAYAANRSVLKRARPVTKQTAFGKGAMSHNQVLGVFAKSKIYVGLSASDGVSTSMLEAMSMGAIPV